MKRLLALLLIIPTISFAKECTKEDAQAIEGQLAESWSQLEVQFREYKQCDDGSIASTFSGSVEYLITNKWLDLHIRKIDAEFNQFIIRHIDLTWSKSSFTKAFTLAESNCPKSSKSICNAILYFNKKI